MPTSFVYKTKTSELGAHCDAVPRAKKIWLAHLNLAFKGNLNLRPVLNVGNFCMSNFLRLFVFAIHPSRSPTSARGYFALLLFVLRDWPFREMPSWNCCLKTNVIFNSTTTLRLLEIIRFIVCLSERMGKCQKNNLHEIYETRCHVDVKPRRPRATFLKLRITKWENGTLVRPRAVSVTDVFLENQVT